MELLLLKWKQSYMTGHIRTFYVCPYRLGRKIFYRMRDRFCTRLCAPARGVCPEGGRPGTCYASTGWEGLSPIQTISGCFPAAKGGTDAAGDTIQT